MSRHAGKVAVCAGSATGMGAESAFRLAQEGAKVVLGDINMDAANAVINRIKTAGGEAVAKEFDISDEASVNALYEEAASRYGGVDITHVNAADLRVVRRDKDALSTDLEVFDRSLAVGLRGHLLCTRAAIPLMQKRGKGSILYTSSAASKTAAPLLVSYYVLKAGLNGLMRHVATRWGPEGIRANAICPGVVLTETVMRNMSEESRQAGMAHTPSTRLGKVEDIAALVAFLLSDEAEWINGQAVSIDGGSVMGI
jgi:NAD(P)-dependent dehydrogenase (short-subunit alcohol dehydrogenase family)